jgi:hypothetical protein
MVVTEDVRRTAAELLLDSWGGLRVVELEGQPVSARSKPLKSSENCSAAKYE